MFLCEKILRIAMAEVTFAIHSGDNRIARLIARGDDQMLSWPSESLFVKKLKGATPWAPWIDSGRVVTLPLRCSC